MKIVFAFWLWSTLCFLESCSNQNTGSVTQTDPINLNDGIATGTLSDAGLDSSAINNLSAQIRSGIYPNMHSLLIYRKNKLVFEQYYPGLDQHWGQDLGVIHHDINSLHDIRSVSKSIVSACNESL